MAELQRFPLTTTTGQTGYVLRRARFIDPAEQSRVILDDGTELLASSNALEARIDGSFLLHEESARSEPESASPPPPEPLPTPVPEAHTAPPAEALYADDVAIERVPVNQIVDQPPVNRQEGDITIVPVVEEVLVVQKRYLIKEEIHIQRRRQQVAEPRRVLLDSRS